MIRPLQKLFGERGRFDLTVCALVLLVAACTQGGLTRAEAIDAALRNAPPSDGPITVDYARDGPLDAFMSSLPGQESARHVWAVGLLGNFEGEGVLGQVPPRYRHHMVILDFSNGAFIVGSGSS